MTQQVSSKEESQEVSKYPMSSFKKKKGERFLLEADLNLSFYLCITKNKLPSDESDMINRTSWTYTTYSA